MSDSPDQYAINAGKAFPWHELYVPDVQKALDFYNSALGMDSSSMQMEGMGAYHMLQHNGNPVAGVVSTTEMQMEGIPPHWAVYVSVDDVDARVAKVLEFGGGVVVPAMDIPTVGRMALINDPQGAMIWLFKSGR